MPSGLNHRGNPIRLRVIALVGMLLAGIGWLDGATAVEQPKQASKAVKKNIPAGKAKALPAFQKQRPTAKQNVPGANQKGFPKQIVRRGNPNVPTTGSGPVSGIAKSG